MKRCRKWLELSVLHHYGELSPRRARRLERHLSRCKDCRLAAQRQHANLAKLTPPHLQEPEPAFWDGFMAKLDQRLDGVAPLPEPRMRLLQSHRGWALSAAALVLVILGGIAGRLIFPPGTVRSATGIVAGNGFTVDLSSHLETLHPLLVDCSTATPAEFAQSLPVDQPRLQDLLLRNRLLMRRAQVQHDAAASELLEEIELILLELSAPATNDHTRIGQVHDLVNRSDLVGRMDILRRRSRPLVGQEARI